MIAHAPGLPVGTGEAATSRDGGVIRLAGLVVALLGLIVVALLSLRIGSVGIGTRDTWNALIQYDPSNYGELVVRTLRLPRTVIALGVGGGLAAAGAVAQAVTRNPLAEPAILGISNGATLGIVVGIYYFHRTATAEFVWLGFAGALLASLLVVFVAAVGRGGTTPVKLALSGLIVSWLLAAWTSTLLLLDEETIDVVRFWVAGSVAGRDLATFWTISPILIGGMVLCGALGHQLNILSLGEETARALGMNAVRMRLIAFGLVVGRRRRGWPDRLRRSRNAAHRALPGRTRLSLGDAVLDRDRRDLPDGGGYRWSGGGTAGGTPGRHRHRARRRAVPDLFGPPPQHRELKGTKAWRSPPPE